METEAVAQIHHGPALLEPLIFLAAAVIAVPIFRRLKLGSVIGYLAAGLIIGPAGLGLFSDQKSVLALAELGVVMLLFIIGLELKLSRLWAMRRDIFGLGLAQVLVCGLALGLIAWLAGMSWPASTILGLGLALSSTAFAAPLMEERSELNSAYGQQAFAILLFQDLAIVPLLALVAFLAPHSGEVNAPGFGQTLAIFGAMAIVILIARYALNPLFGILAKSNAHEIMTAAALLVVLGAALIMQLAGLSMAMGAFMAGVLLAESSFRHELEANIEPFRGLLLGLFFITVGMGIDLKLVFENMPLVVAGVFILMGLKAIIIYSLSRLAGATHNNGLRIGGVLSQGGEFAFVLFAAATTAGIITEFDANLTVAIVTISLALTPPVFALANRVARPAPNQDEPELDFTDAHGKVIIIGFGRFGQVIAQFLLGQGIELTAIERDVESIQTATRFGFKVYYGDGTRLDVLRIAGASNASLIAICIKDKTAIRNMVEMVQKHFPLAKIYVRAYDRVHALELLDQNVDYQIRETLDSAMSFGRAALEELGFSPEESAEVEKEMRYRDAERLAAQQIEGVMGGASLMHTRTVKPEPLKVPLKKGETIDAEPDAHG